MSWNLVIAVVVIGVPTVIVAAVLLAMWAVSDEPFTKVAPYARPPKNRRDPLPPPKLSPADEAGLARMVAAHAELKVERAH